MMGWATDGGEDIGQQLTEQMIFEEVFQIKADRKRRVKELAGKYVITTIGKDSGRTVFLQNPKISNEGYWTQYLSNALGFEKLDKARLVARKFKYGNIRIAIVTFNGNYHYI